MNPVRTILATTLLAAAAALAAPADAPETTAQRPAYTPEGKLVVPSDYREWIFLTASLDMSYDPDHSNTGGHVFDNVFVQPAAYRAFVETGQWPDGTILAKEVRKAGSRASINRSGHFQTPKVLELELHVRDSGRFKDNWAFFVAPEGRTAERIPEQASCYSCHRESGAVDNTFVQFYPTLLGIARAKGTAREPATTR